jgi:hypothetical protein
MTRFWRVHGILTGERAHLRESGLNTWLALLFVSCTVTPIVHAQITLNTTTATLLAKAPADECYTGLGENTPADYPPCAAGQIPKVNQSYVWSEVDTGDDVWFGTVANALCTTEGTQAATTTGTTPYQTAGYVCEYGAGPYSPVPLPAPVGDFRPPRIYVYNKASKILTDVTPHNAGAHGNTGFDPLLAQTSGLRAAVIAGNDVIFAGPELNGGLAFFAYDISSKLWVAKGELNGYINIRKFLNVNGVIYTGVAKTSQGGAVLRYTGSFATIPPPTRGQGAGTCPACFSFQTVGALDSDAAYLALHNGRVYVATWPNGGLGGLYMGPPVPTGGYTISNAAQWLKVWDATQYDPDPVIATSYAGGALMSFGGYLYWGTINVPFSGYNAWVAAYGTPPTQTENQTVVADTFRTAVVFRSPGFDVSPVEVDLLYGASSLQAYTPPAGGGTEGTWASTPNKMPAGTGTPLYGLSGFNNFYNVYIWSMAIWQNKLWVGTFDWSWVVSQSQTITTLPSNTKGNPLVAALPLATASPSSTFGADLVFFNDANSPATFENRTGLGNPTSYGVRNLLVSSDSSSMYAGMANNANLLADPSNPPNGGWELIQLQPIATSTAVPK